MFEKRQRLVNGCQGEFPSEFDGFVQLGDVLSSQLGIGVLATSLSPEHCAHLIHPFVGFQSTAYESLEEV